MQGSESLAPILIWQCSTWFMAGQCFWDLTWKNWCKLVQIDKKHPLDTNKLPTSHAAGVMSEAWGAPQRARKSEDERGWARMGEECGPRLWIACVSRNYPPHPKERGWARMGEDERGWAMMGPKIRNELLQLGVFRLICKCVEHGRFDSFMPYLRHNIHFHLKCSVLGLVVW